MKFVCVLLAVTFWAVAAAEKSPTVLTLNKVMNELKKIKDWSKGKDNDTTKINAPTVNDIKDSCIASALECFRSKVIYVPFNNKMPLITIQRDLRKSFIVNSVSKKQPEKAQCEPCDSYPAVNRHTFLENFQTLLQKIFIMLQRAPSQR